MSALSGVPRMERNVRGKFQMFSSIFEREISDVFALRVIEMLTGHCPHVAVSRNQGNSFSTEPQANTDKVFSIRWLSNANAFIQITFHEWL
jgi:hypothetical protein